MNVRELVHAWQSEVPDALVALGLGWSGAWALLRLARETRTWTHPKVIAAMGVALRRLLVFTAAAAVCSKTSSTRPSVVTSGFAATPLYSSPVDGSCCSRGRSTSSHSSAIRKMW